MFRLRGSYLFGFWGPCLTFPFAVLMVRLKAVIRLKCMLLTATLQFCNKARTWAWRKRSHCFLMASIPPVATKWRVANINTLGLALLEALQQSQEHAAISCYFAGQQEDQLRSKSALQVSKSRQRQRSTSKSIKIHSKLHSELICKHYMHNHDN